MITILHKAGIAFRREYLREACRKNYDWLTLMYAVEDYNRAVKRYYKYVSRHHAVILNKYPSGDVIALEEGVIL